MHKAIYRKTTNQKSWIFHIWSNYVLFIISFSNLGHNYILEDQFMVHLILNIFFFLLWCGGGNFSKLLDFSRQLFWVPTILCYLQNWMFCPVSPFKVVRLEAFLHKQVLFFFSRQSFWVPETLCYHHNWMFCPITPFQVVRFENFLHE